LFFLFEACGGTTPSSKDAFNSGLLFRDLCPGARYVFLSRLGASINSGFHLGFDEVLLLDDSVIIVVVSIVAAIGLVSNSVSVLFVSDIFLFISVVFCVLQSGVCGGVSIHALRGVAIFVDDDELLNVHDFD